MIILIRILFLAGCSFFGYYASHFSWFQQLSLPQSVWMGAVLGFLGGAFVISLDVYFKRFTVRNILSVLLGLALGLLVHRLYMSVMAYAGFPVSFERQMGILSAIIFSYLGMVTVLRGQDEFALMIPFVKLDTKGSGEELILLDTSVIIDGRIADIGETHFMSGKLILPRFVLKELQLISDSSDPLKRNRGRRGLDILNRMKANTNIKLKINEMDFEDLNNVDSKLVKMALVLNAKLFTNDFNLNKVAELQGVKVLNINDLANALKPVVMPGELMQVKILKEGKEHDQGIAYLDDGTMVVVDNSRRKLGQTLMVSITSVLQTQAGRMIFAKLNGEPDRAGGDRQERFFDRGRDRAPRSQEKRREASTMKPTGNFQPPPLASREEPAQSQQTQ